MQNLLCQVTLAGVMLTTSFNPTWGWDGSTQENINNTEDKFLCLQPIKIRPSTAAKVLCAIARARISIHDKTFAQATNPLHHARTLIDLIKYADSPRRLKDQLWEVKKNFDYESSEKIALDLLPLDLALTNLEYFVPVAEAKNYLNAAHASLQNKDKVTAKNHLEALNNALIYMEQVLPLKTTEHYIAKAQELLTHNEVRQADAVLQGAETGIELISLRVDVVPIGPAMKSHWRRMETYSTGNVEAGKTDLRQPGVWFTRNVPTRDEEVKDEATTIAGELKMWAEETRQKAPVFETAYQSLWQKTTALTEHEAAKAVVGWQILRKQTTTNMPLQNTLKLKMDLTNAKFHLTYAEIFEFITHEAKKAQTSIEKAQMHLRAAEKLTDGRFKVEIEALAQESALIHKELMNDENSNMIRYTKVKNDVRQLLQELSW